MYLLEPMEKANAGEKPRGAKLNEEVKEDGDANYSCLRLIKGHHEDANQLSNWCQTGVLTDRWGGDSPVSSDILLIYMAMQYGSGQYASGWPSPRQIYHLNKHLWLAVIVGLLGEYGAEITNLRTATQQSCRTPQSR